jgi:signal transduction histidine kinase
LGNAIKYNKPKGTVNIVLDKNTLTVTDTWIGIEKSKQAKVFDRFYKTNTVRNSEGYGIWLSLVKKITDMYKWKTELNSSENAWTSFIIKFR